LVSAGRSRWGWERILLPDDNDEKEIRIYYPSLIMITASSRTRKKKMRTSRHGGVLRRFP